MLTLHNTLINKESTHLTICLLRALALVIQVEMARLNMFQNINQKSCYEP